MAIKSQSGATFSGRWSDAIMTAASSIEEEYPEINSVQGFLNILAEKFNSSNADLQKIIEERDSAVKELHDLKTQIAEDSAKEEAVTNEELDNLKAQLLALSLEKQNLVTEKESLTSLVSSLESKIAPSDVVVHLNERMKILLDTTVERLNARYNSTTITASELLQKMFLRYTVEQCIEWFYPFVLSEGDIARITGISIKQWEAFINK